MSVDQTEEGTHRPTPVEVEETLLGGERRYTRRELAELAGVSFPYAQRLWRAMGFAEVGDDEVAFTDGDLVTLKRAAELLRSGLLDEELGVRLARALGQSMGRLAEWQANTLVEQVATPGARPPNSSMRAAVDVAEQLVPEFEALVVHMWRRQLAASGVRAFAAADSGQAPTRLQLAVGFADLSFARLPREPDDEERLGYVDRFEVVSSDAVAALGGRVVKTLGEELLFVADSPVAAGETALRLTETLCRDESPLEARVGVAYGTALLRFGDVSGATVDLASRLTSRARPGSVLVDANVASALAGETHYALQSVPQTSSRGLGAARPYLLSRGEEQAPSAPGISV